MQKVLRLVETFVPSHYDLSLSIDRSARLFTGLVKIIGTSKSDKITLHSKDLEIISVNINDREHEFKLGQQDQLAISEVESGENQVEIKFTGKITEPMHGMYPCFFKHDDIDKELIATQFESNHAHEVFPCIDEPEAKATFDVTLETESDIIVMGNMPIAKQSTKNSRLTTKFETTPRMSTYLLAWTYGELQKKSIKTKRGVEVNVWSTPAQKSNNLDFALDIAKRSIEFYEEYFGVDYPLPKSDHVALPDFSSGAMENWGLITYREIALLVDPETTGIDNKRYTATVIAHELAHQWFGNLVTMKWWNDLWLNESFATMMEYIAVDNLQPDWDILLDFASNETSLAFSRDSIDGVQSVQVEVSHPDEIRSLFDGAIVYAKGARLLWMLRNFVGDKDFQNGLKHYFKQFAYSNSVGDDLWASIAKSSNKDIAKLMNTWISQPGYPVISMESNKQGAIKLTQSQFFIGPHESSSRKWPIPLVNDLPSIPKLMSSESITFKAKPNININSGSTSHFIVNRDQQSFEAVLSDIRSNKLSVLDRLQFIHENILLAKSGMIESKRLISLVQEFKHEDSNQVWNMISYAIGYLKKFTEGDEELSSALKKLTWGLVKEQYHKLGWQESLIENDDTKKLRSTIISLAVYSNTTEATNEARRIYDTTKIEDIDPDLREIVLSSIVKHDKSGNEVTALVGKYQNNYSASIKSHLRSGITSTHSSEQIDKLLSYLKDTKIIRSQDVTSWFVSLMRNYRGRKQTWQWLRENWTWIDKTFSGDMSYDSFPQYAANLLNTSEQLQEYEKFFVPKKNIPALNRTITLGINDIKGRIEVLDKNQDSVREALLNL